MGVAAVRPREAPARGRTQDVQRFLVRPVLCRVDSALGRTKQSLAKTIVTGTGERRWSKITTIPGQCEAW